MNQLTVKVVRKQREAEGIFSYELAAADGAALPRFSAGAHIDVYIRPGLIRQYSLCNHPRERHRYVIAVLREPNSRGGSHAMHDAVHAGDVIEISEPRNHFPLTPAARTLLFAGGIGITPILSMAERLSEMGADFALHYCCRSADRAAFVDRIADAAYARHAHFHYDDGDDGQRLVLSATLGEPAPDKHLYVCGPTGFISYIVESAKANGWRDDAIHLEYFGAKPADPSKQNAFSVQIASTGRIIDVPADKSVVTALEAHGVTIPVSCEQGVCGTCLTRVLRGEPDHRDLYLTDEEKARNDQFTPCCSRSKSEMLVLDL
ncbi:Vanillate O-demethylase oxidoreductase [Pandoraea terrae]|uniref:Vanillate O-demethylase oxidoreductase n=1 Tax=Pandoraea terrae TaxID=1537710 RepID=A0A5E4RRS5_9BURK|nr:PDR/VanB family oxidoreductase [Pandoraea terrae]VVD66116.1 Vanillate O-demethylase oxidoreductase [Pandoraea terrae]